MGYNPVDFWRSHPEDYWMIIDAKQEARKAQDRSQYAGMTLSEVEEIYREAHGGIE